MGLFELFAPKEKQQSVTLQPVKPVKVNSTNNYYFAGMSALKLDTQTLGTLSQAFKDLLKFYTDTKSLGTKDAIDAARFIINYHPYGKKAVSIFKAFCINELEFEETISEQEKQEYLTVLNSCFESESALKKYIMMNVFKQGGVAFWLDVDPETEQLKVINIPFTEIETKFDAASQEWKYDTKKINLTAINASLPPAEQYKFCSDLPQFFVFFFDTSDDEPQPTSFFSAAIEDCYTETLFRRLIREAVKRLAILKHAHFTIKQPDKENLGARSLFETDNTLSPEVKKAAEEISDQIANPSGKIVENPETERNYAFLQSMSITDENVTMQTFSTMETAAIKPIGDAVKEPLAAGLRVPAQFLGISESRTETQIEIELEMFLETERELREFIDKVMIGIIQFHLWMNGKELSDPYPFWIKDSDVAGNLKRQKAAREKTEINGLELDNLTKLRDLGFVVTDNEIIALGYEAVRGDSNNQNTNSPNEGVSNQ